MNLTTNSTTLSKFDYAYDAMSQITSWTRQTDMTATNVYNFQYDGDGRLLNGVLQDSNSGAVSQRYVYGYSQADNRTSEQINDSVTQSTHNNLNQLVSQQAGGPLRFKGSVNETSAVYVAGQIAGLSWTNVNGTNTLFQSYPSVSTGTNVVSIVAHDYNGKSTTNRYQVVEGAAANRLFTYDLNGNLITESNATTVISNVWDAANRLVGIYSNSTYVSLFTYDGLSRRARQTEISSGATNSDNRMLWCGTALCEERTPPAARLIGGSLHRASRSRDRISSPLIILHSIREMTSTNGTVQARYDYDPYGRRMKVAGAMDADFGFTGHYFHAPSGLDLTLYRGFSANLGLWLSRDPVGEPQFRIVSEHKALGKLRRKPLPTVLSDGPNLYSYVGGRPVTSTDSLGLQSYSSEECEALLNQIDSLFAMKGRWGFNNNDLQTQINELNAEYEDNCGDDDEPPQECPINPPSQPAPEPVSSPSPFTSNPPPPQYWVAPIVIIIIIRMLPVLAAAP